MNVKAGWMLFEYNGVSLMGGNCKKSFINNMFTPPNVNMLLLNFCNFRCVVPNMLQPTIEISSTMMNSIVGQMFVTKFGLLTMTCLSINKLSKKWIIVPPTDNATLICGIYIYMQCEVFVHYLFW